MSAPNKNSNQCFMYSHSSMLQFKKERNSVRLGGMFHMISMKVTSKLVSNSFPCT